MSDPYRPVVMALLDDDSEVVVDVAAERLDDGTVSWSVVDPPGNTVGVTVSADTPMPDGHYLVLPV